MSPATAALLAAVLSLVGTALVGWLTFRASKNAQDSEDHDRTYKRLDALATRLEGRVKQLEERVQQLEEQGTRDALQIRLLRRYVGALVKYIDDTGPHATPRPEPPAGLDL